MRRPPVYIWEIIGEIVQATSDAVVDKVTGLTLLQTIQANEVAVLGETHIQQIRYSKSSFNELIETLSQADGSAEERYNKYPLIHLVRDFYEERGQDPGAYATASLNIIIIHQTVNTYKVADREVNVFKPVLYPIYQEFLEQLDKSGWTKSGDLETFRHRKIDHAFWGNRKLETLNDYVDAIEIQNLNIKINFFNCKLT